MNRGNYRGKRKMTGRFFAFISVAVVALVFIIVLATRGGGTPPVVSPPTNPPVTNETATEAPSDQEDWNDGLSSAKDLGGEADPVGQITEADNVDDSELSVTLGLDPTWRNILLLGTDTRNPTKNARTDTIMIASVNTQNGRIKLTSIMRDTVVPLTWRGESDKINAAAYFAGPKGAIRAVNEAFQMNITEYILVNFTGMKEAIDVIGGILVDVSPEEQAEINHNIKEQAKMFMTYEEWTAQKSQLELETYGAQQRLTGLQAVGYARIRKIGEDFGRVSRQQTVMEALLTEARNLQITQLARVALAVSDDIHTNISTQSLIGLATTVLKNGISKLETGRIPMNNTFKDTVRDGKSALWDVDLEKNTQRLHQFIYAE